MRARWYRFGPLIGDKRQVLFQHRAFSFSLRELVSPTGTVFPLRGQIRFRGRSLFMEQDNERSVISDLSLSCFVARQVL